MSDSHLLPFKRPVYGSNNEASTNPLQRKALVSWPKRPTWSRSRSHCRSVRYARAGPRIVSTVIGLRCVVTALELFPRHAALGVIAQLTGIATSLSNLLYRMLFTVELVSKCQPDTELAHCARRVFASHSMRTWGYVHTDERRSAVVSAARRATYPANEASKVFISAQRLAEYPSD